MTMTTTTKPIISERQIIKIGNTFYISLPKEWLQSNGINKGDLLFTIAQTIDSDLRIINPKNEAGIYNDISKAIRKERK